MRRIYSIIAFFCIAFSTLSAESALEYFMNRNEGVRLFIGPEAYYAYRHREGGTKQRGWLGGGRLIFDRFVPCGIYGAIEGAVASGEIKGHSGRGAKLKSRMRDRSFESRVGFTFTWEKWYNLSFTPFVGIGYYIEDNDFKKPSPLPLHFKTSYRYGTAGFLASFCPYPLVTAGVNLKVRQMVDPRCKISNDPDYETADLHIDNEPLQYRVELPVIYRRQESSWVITPFYEMRDYGRKASFPFDFLRTRVYNYGATFQYLLEI